MNSTFAAAIAALQQAQDEINRVSSSHDAAIAASDAVEQRLAQLRKNETDLTNIINGLAQQVADARTTIANAPNAIH
jgi:uncharacterized protein YhaN